MNERPAILLGAGGHAKVLLDILLEQDVKVLGIADKTDNDIGTESGLYGIPIIGSDADVLRYSPEDIELVNGIGSIASTELRRSVYEKFKARGYCFRQVVHSSAVISKRAVLSEGVQVMAGAVINIGTQIGENSIVNTRASIDHDCVVGAHVHIAPGATLSGGVTVGDGCHIGTGATIVQGMQIGIKTIVGAGAVVVSNLTGKTVFCGVPARLIKGKDRKTQEGRSE